MPSIPPETPVLITGTTASGKSALALRICQDQGGVIINADASQVFSCWRLITARPDKAEEAQVPHALYGHVPFHQHYSVGHWLREVTPLLQNGPRPIIVGGSGLYFRALTQGLADIPPVPTEIRQAANALSLETLRAQIHPDTLARLDAQNRARVQRAWEVETSSQKPLHQWQDETAPPLLPREAATALVVDVAVEQLNQRIAKRFDAMLAAGALAEVAAMRDQYDPDLPAFRAIGVPELMAHVQGALSLEEAKDAAITATRQYAKRQRTWLRSNAKSWQWLTRAQAP